MRCAVALLFVVLLGACGSDREPAPAPAPALTSKPRVDATDLLVKFECARCHEVPKLAAAPRDKHCVQCHRQIHDNAFEGAKPEDLQRWQPRVKGLQFAPSLASAERLRRDSIRDFLLAPHDVRPNLVLGMPRLQLTPADAERIAAHLSSDDDAPFTGDAKRGEELYGQLACGRCHRFTGAKADDVNLRDLGVLDGGMSREDFSLAPDLRRARDRMTPWRMAAWIAAPKGAMPDLKIAPTDARDLAAFIAQTPLEPPQQRTVARLPILDRAVTWDEVEKKVFRNLCWHCHAVPDFARGDGGPGNSGGFGYPPRGLDVSSYAGISSGALDDTGNPRSIFAPMPDGTPRVIAVLLARHAEEAGTFTPLVGMPLGLPALPPEEIQLVDTWIAQGRPR